jgi:hypothetical protein
VPTFLFLEDPTQKVIHGLLRTTMPALLACGACSKPSEAVPRAPRSRLGLVALATRVDHLPMANISTVGTGSQ